ncbi:MAG: pyridoxal phosphate-dependent aminotransferase [Candidatus Saccharicenans sp.]|nr:MAG: aminotransferase class I and II [Candidatus Aminicenantes bacterium]HEK85328.1 pyridoxal phosphate-dependent aminotransferase [Candidatus Aminicenantes bacterium]
MVSERVTKIGASPTLKISAKAKAMKAEGLDVVDLSVGEPDFPTPENIKSAAIKAIEQNFTKYTENDGIPELRKAVCLRLKEDYGVEYKPNEILVSSGAKNSLFNLIQAIVNEGDEVIIPAPYWVTYPECVNLAKGKPVIVETREEDGFLLTPGLLRAAITPSTRALILNNPGNPTGAVYSEEQLRALAEVIKKEDIYIIADEIYSRLVFDGFRFVSFAALGEDIKKKTILITGVSKSYSMTGWRIGFAAGPTEIISAMSKVQSHTTSNACSISQKASVEALVGPQYEVNKMVAEFQRRRNYVLMRLQQIPGISCFKPQGAFYVFPNVKSFYGKEAGGIQIRNSYGLAYYLLKEAQVAIVPGDAFGADDYIRISYATSMANLEKGLDRIAEAMSRLKTAKKVKQIYLQNYVTRVKKPVPIEVVSETKMRDALVAEMESHLGYENYYEWNANINGTIVQLKTNVGHLYDFWVENWFPGQIEAGLEPHAIIYAVDNVAGREPRAYYHPETRTGLLVNTDNYGALRKLALGMVIDSQEHLGINAVRGMAVAADGNSLILIGQPGTGKTELFFKLLKKTSVQAQTNEILFVRFSGNRAVADSVERKFYIPTNTVELYDKLAKLFDHSKCENVVTRREDCTDRKCPMQDDCRLDKGAPYCFRASSESQAMLDPNWISGPSGYVKRTNLKALVILRNDQTSPAVVELTKEEALKCLESGEPAGAIKAVSAKAQPFFNPHLIVMNEDKMALERMFFSRLLDQVKCYLANSAVVTADQLKSLL